MASKFTFYGKEYTSHFQDDERAAYIGSCLCATTGILFFVPLVAAPESKYAKFWANQGLITLIVEILCVIAGLFSKMVFWLISLILPFIAGFFTVLNAIVVIALWAIAVLYVAYGIYYVSKKRAKNLPYIGYMRFINEK